MKNPNEGGTQKTGRSLAPMTDMTAREHTVILDPYSVDYEEAARMRGYVDNNAVDRLAQSIRLTGQVQPLLCVCDPETTQYKLVDGLHRLLACRKLNIPVNVQRIHHTWFQEEPELQHVAMLQMELDSILVRADVTHEQRERLMAAHIENRDKLVRLRDGEDDAPSSANRTRSSSANRTRKKGATKAAQWFTEAYEAVGIAKRTAFEKWAAYLKAGGREHIPPSKATEDDKAGFAAHLKGNAEEAQQKAMESEQARKQVAIEKATEALRGAIHVLVKHGVDVESLVKEVLVDA